ncbi:MAG: hypoxanthine phosphoribosyltransferase [Anaerolineae bacterium]|nr:hypoxanthine phosphoribosyltransferase [Anaerolineae bacterium]MBT3713122.1 hypoxanthine phosphoribosyltransferase [Anaerolineae bacterium]MBT4309169.1 hypoxanthine phosphoribosyltransferase [Anaerolineae bacterium]MBT4459644.1 hypoxanthine phosphoribosyltransferase [Anaerolineae bacterium]MBT4841599.1 hypoxanthine phosphoribosyltransferase [Anaerolineae bacterium]
MMEDYKNFLKEVLITRENLQKRITELGEEISQDYEGKELLLISILRGGVFFTVDLMKNIDIPHVVEFMGISSYGIGARESTGNVRITYDIQTNIKDKHVLLVEDIIDSGHTLSSVIEKLRIQHPASLEVCTLLDKASRREVDVPIRYCGFDIEDKFVFGYGLDIDEYFRGLPFIGVVDLDKYEPED